MPHGLILLFARYGYLLVIGAVLLENAGIPAPGHTVMLAAGALAQQGYLNLTAIIAAGAVAAVIGDNVGFIVGRHGGRALLLKHGPKILISAATLEKADRFYARHGAKAVFLARFVTGLQTVGALLAGSSRMRWQTFFVWNLLGALTWALVYATLGYLFGSSWELLERWVGRAGLAVVALAVIALAAWLLHRHRPLSTLLDRVLPSEMDRRRAALWFFVVCSVGLFAKITEDVVSHESTWFDRTVSLGVHRFDTPVLDHVMKLFTTIGSFPIVVCVVAVVAAFCVRMRDRAAAGRLIGVVALTEALNALLKHLFARVRPNLFEEIATLHSYSFPSGHAMSAAAIYGMVAVVLARLMPRLQGGLYMTTFILAFMIGLSRIYLGVHWVTDVLAGYAIGATILFGGVLWLEASPNRSLRWLKPWRRSP